MNNFDRISPYRQPTIPTYQNVETVDDVEFLQKLPKDVLEMIQKGDLEGAMNKLHENDQENESFMRLFLQLLGEMTTNLWKPFTEGTNKFFSLFRRADTDPVHQKDKVDRPARVEDRRDLKAASSEKLSPEEQKALYMQQEVEKLNKQPEVKKPSLLDHPIIKQLGILAEKSNLLRQQTQILLALLITKPFKFLKEKVMDKGAAPLLEMGKFLAGNIKDLGTAIDQKLVMPLLKTLSMPFLPVRNFLESATEEMKRLYESFKEKVVEPIKEKLRVFEPFVEKFIATRNKAVGITRSAAEWLSDRVNVIKTTVKTWTPSFKPAIQYVDQRVRDLTEYASNIKEVVQQNIQVAVEAFQQITHVAIVTMLPMINLFAFAHQTTLRYSLAGIKSIQKKLQEGFSTFQQKVKVHLKAMQKKIAAATIITIDASTWFLKTLYKMLIDLLNACKEVFLRFMMLVWKVAKGGGFIFWNILSTLPSATAFLIRKSIKKLKKSVLESLRKRQLQD